jgi:sulfur-oxidizing protein SoxZ
MRTTRIIVPPRARRGEVVEIKALITHPMETGYRRDNVGRPVPRDIITRFCCSYAGETVFAMDLFTGVAANPFVAFSTVATETGDLVFSWIDQHGAETRETRRLVVA